MGMKVDAKFAEINTTVTLETAHELRRASIRDDESAGGCCSGPGTAGTDRLKDLYLKPENGSKFRDLSVRAYLSQELGFGAQAAVNTSFVEKK